MSQKQTIITSTSFASKLLFSLASGVLLTFVFTFSWAQGNSLVTLGDVESANTALLVTAGIVDISAVVIFFIFFWLVSKRDLMHPVVRFFVLAIVMSAVAAVVIALAHPQTVTVLRALQIPQLQGEVFLGSLNFWLKGLILGAGPVFLLSLVIKVVSALFLK